MNQGIVANAVFFSSRIPLGKAKPIFGQHQLVKKENSFLLYRLGTEQYCYLKDYGSIVFFNLDDQQQLDIIRQVEDIAGITKTDITETITVVVGEATDETVFDVIHVPQIDKEAVHIVCINVAQSAALFYYQSLSEQLLENTRVHTNELENKGKVSLGRKKLMRYIGSTLNIKNRISENLFIFDTPMIAWQDEEIHRIDAQLNDELEIKYRYNAIKEQVSIIHENLDLFKDVNMHRHSSNLEWIIIWLILFEVIHVIIGIFS